MGQAKAPYCRSNLFPRKLAPGDYGRAPNMHWRTPTSRIHLLFSSRGFNLTIVPNIFWIRLGFSLARFVPTYCLVRPLTVSATGKSFKPLHLPMTSANGSTVSTPASHISIPDLVQVIQPWLGIAVLPCQEVSVRESPWHVPATERLTSTYLTTPSLPLMPRWAATSSTTASGASSKTRLSFSSLISCIT